MYYVTAAYRNEKGKPTCDRTSIGRLDEETGKLIPNRNYYEIYLKKPMPVNTGIQDCGVADMAQKLSKKLGVTKLVHKYFPENAEGMLTAAQYMLSEGNVMCYIDEYTETHQTPTKGTMSNEMCSKMFASLRQEDMQLFFREWMKQKKQTEYVAYDVTSISSHSSNIRDLEWGYNRDKERLPQINMGMYYGEESGLPLYYRGVADTVKLMEIYPFVYGAIGVHPDEVGDLTDGIKKVLSITLRIVVQSYGQLRAYEKTGFIRLCI